MFFRIVSLMIVVFHLILGSYLPLFAEDSEKDSRLKLEESRCKTGDASSFRYWDSECENGAQTELKENVELGRELFLAQGIEYQVHILGEVTSPGTYRIAPSTRLSEAIALVGGILERGSERRIQLRRNEKSTQLVDLLMFKIKGKVNENPYLNDNDVVFVPLREGVIQVVGTVKRPGNYELRNEKTLQQVVELAGGFTPGVGNPAPINVIRFVDGEKRRIEIPNLQENRKEFQVKNADVVVVPHFLTKEKKFDYNVAALPGDNKLFYPSYDERVFVIGAVSKPGPYPFSPYYTVSQYLTLAGGASNDAKAMRKWRILPSDGHSKRRARLDSEINPGDTIVVPQKSFPPSTLVSVLLTGVSTILGVVSTVVVLTN